MIEVSAVTAALGVEFYSDIPHLERNPVKMIQTSKNRVAHTIEITDNFGFDDVLKWINESYCLARTK